MKFPEKRRERKIYQQFIVTFSRKVINIFKKHGLLRDSGDQGKMYQRCAHTISTLLEKYKDVKLNILSFHKFCKSTVGKQRKNCSCSITPGMPSIAFSVAVQS